MAEMKEKLVKSLYSKIDSIFNANPNKQVIFIGESYYKDIFLSYKKDNPKLNLSYKTKSEVVEELEFKVTHKMISFIIHNYNYDFVKASKLLKILPYININSSLDKLSDKEKEVIKIKEELIKNGLINYDEYSIYSYKNDDILLVLFELSSDNSFLTLLKNHNITSYLTLEFEEVSNEEVRDYFDNKIYNFKNHIKEENYLGSTISKLILEENVNPSSIYVYLNGDYDYYISFLESLYNLKFNYVYKRSLSSNPLISKYISLIDLNKKVEVFDLTNIDENELNYVTYINDIIKEYDLDSLSDSNKAFLSLNEILASINEIKPSSIEGINLISSPTFKVEEDSIFFMLDFKYDVFYKEYKDDDVLSDVTLSKFNLTTSFEKTLNSKILMLYFSLFNNVKFFSRVKLHLDEKIYDSQYIEEYKLNPINKEINLDGLYFSPSKELVYKAFLNDKTNQNRGSYDSSFKKFDFKKKEKITVSALDEFNKCPFKYYVSQYLKIDPYKTDYTRMVGNILHKFLEGVYKKDLLPLEEVKKELMEEILPLEEKACKYVFSSKEKIIFEETVIPYFYDGYKSILANKSENYIDDMSENKVDFMLIDNDGKVSYLEGRYDSLISLKDDEYVVIDYKSGKTVKLDLDEIEEGDKLQAPLYAYAISKEYDTKKASAYLQPILQELHDKDGYYNSKRTYENSLNPKGFSYEKLFNEDEKEAIINLVLEKTKEILSAINNSDFDISPKNEGDDRASPCSYCSYKDICFKKE